MQDIVYFQDGSWFYYSFNDSGIDEPGYSIEAPLTVRDFDFEAAIKADNWFKDWCKRHRLNPVEKVE